MTRFYVEVVCQVTGLSRPELEAKLEKLADAVFDLTGVVDPDLGADLGKALAHFNMGVDADDEAAALAYALAAVRSALHQVGGSTAGWEKHFQTIEETVRTADALV